MTPQGKSTIVLSTLAVVCAVLTLSFLRVPAQPDHPERAPIVPRDALAITPGTVRVSAGQLMRSGGDTSGLACYACHHQDTPPEVKYDSEHRVVLPKEHADLIFSMRNCMECHPANDPVKLEYDAAGVVIAPAAHQGLLAMGHGRNFRNDNCYNCHDRDQLDQLHTAEGTKLKFDQATLLCAGCHGPTYRDWEAGVHGRTSGYWNRRLGPIDRQECTSCHDPHAPAFTGLIPMPGPHLLHPPASPPRPPASNPSESHAL